MFMIQSSNTEGICKEQNIDDQTSFLRQYQGSKPFGFTIVLSYLYNSLDLL